ncbi:hypothetical protein [Sphaerisporangium sp. NPDC051011]|uniref:hypothetical protein n=1 Tax=Sphaerisporangium sp. NPDC051011 TaxID=3155792 RepID=UPI003406E93B
MAIHIGVVANSRDISPNLHLVLTEREAALLLSRGRSSTNALASCLPRHEWPRVTAWLVDEVVLEASTTAAAGFDVIQPGTRTRGVNHDRAGRPKLEHEEIHFVCHDPGVAVEV